MKYFMLIEIDIHDTAWVKDYLTTVTAMVERYGGTYHSRTPKIELLEGTRSFPQIMALVEWPSQDTARAFYDSEEYRPFREARKAGTTTSITLMAAEDMNKRN